MRRSWRTPDRPVPARAGVDPTRSKRAEPVASPGRQIDDGDAERVGNAPARRIHVGPCQQRRYFQIAEIALQLVGGEVRIEGNADRRRGDRDDRHRRLGAARQYHRHPVAPAYAEPSQLPNCVARSASKARHMLPAERRAPGGPRGRGPSAHGTQGAPRGTKRPDFRPPRRPIGQQSWTSPYLFAQLELLFSNFLSTSSPRWKRCTESVL